MKGTSTTYSLLFKVEWVFGAASVYHSRVVGGGGEEWAELLWDNSQLWDDFGDKTFERRVERAPFPWRSMTMTTMTMRSFSRGWHGYSASEEADSSEGEAQMWGRICSVIVLSLGFFPPHGDDDDEYGGREVSLSLREGASDIKEEKIIQQEILSSC